MVSGGNSEPFFLPNGTLFFATPSSHSCFQPDNSSTGMCPADCSANAFLGIERAETIEDAIAGNWTVWSAGSVLPLSNPLFWRLASFNLEQASSIASSYTLKASSTLPIPFFSSDRHPLHLNFAIVPCILLLIRTANRLILGNIPADNAPSLHSPSVHSTTASHRPTDLGWHCKLYKVLLQLGGPNSMGRQTRPFPRAHACVPRRRKRLSS
jgi:hypothetical protein